MRAALNPRVCDTVFNPLDFGSQQIPQIIESLVHRVFEIGDPGIAVKHTTRYANQNDHRLAANCHSEDLDISHFPHPIPSTACCIHGTPSA
jgi:hypothetical protein